MKGLPVMREVLGFRSVHNAVGTRRLHAARDELTEAEARLQRLDEAEQWVAENWTATGDEPFPPAVALEQVRDWGDGAWTVAGRAEERAMQLLSGVKMIGGLLQFEGDTDAATGIVRELVDGKPVQQETVTVDPSFADWTPNCFGCGKPLGDWANALMLPASQVEDDEPDGVCFMHRNCGVI